MWHCESSPHTLHVKALVCVYVCVSLCLCLSLSHRDVIEGPKGTHIIMPDDLHMTLKAFQSHSAAKPHGNCSLNVTTHSRE